MFPGLLVFLVVEHLRFSMPGDIDALQDNKQDSHAEHAESLEINPGSIVKVVQDVKVQETH